MQIIGQLSDNYLSCGRFVYTVQISKHKLRNKIKIEGRGLQALH